MRNQPQSKPLQWPGLTADESLIYETLSKKLYEGPLSDNEHELYKEYHQRVEAAFKELRKGTTLA